MKLGIYLAKSKIDFNPTEHFQEDALLFSLEIIEEEGKVAQAFLTFQNMYSREEEASWWGPVKEGQYVYISAQEDRIENVQLLFIGRLLEIPKEITEEFITIRATALPENALDQEQELLCVLKDRDAYDTLFEARSLDISLRSILEKTPYVLHWDRIDHNASLAHYITGKQQKTLSKDILKKDITVQLKTVPLHKLFVEMEVEWAQRATGVVDIFPHIAKHFEGGYINTLTGPDFLKRWWQAGETLGSIGYRIVRSSLKPISVPTPHFSKRYTIPLKEKDPIFLKHFWFKGELFLKWEYRQKRQESLYFVMETSSQGQNREEGDEEILTIKHGNITANMYTSPWKEGNSYKIGDEVLYGEYAYGCLQPHTSQNSFYADIQYWVRKGLGRGALEDYGASSFFLTERGKRSFEHALYWARSYIIRRARCIEIAFQGSIQDLGHLSTADYLEIEDPTLPGGRSVGKVVYYHLRADSREGIEGITVKVAKSYASSEKVEIRKEAFTSPEGISYGSFGDQKPVYGLLNPKNLHASDIVKYIAIHNPTVAQKKALSSVEFFSKEEVEACLSQNRTSLTIHLQEMRQNIPLFHKIHVPWVEAVSI